MLTIITIRPKVCSAQRVTVNYFSPKIQSEQEKIEHSYANLKGLCEERKNRLEQAVELFKLNRDVDDLEIWINEREIVAGSHEMGQDLEHVIVSVPYLFCNRCYDIRLKLWRLRKIGWRKKRLKLRSEW